MPAQVVYTDVTNDPSARARVNDAPDFAAALHHLGFRSIGLIRATMTGEGWEDAMRAGLHPEDAEEMIRRIQQGEVDDILSIGGQTPALGKIDWFFGELVSFETILDNGAIIETTMKPARSPRPRPGGAVLVDKKENDPISRTLFRWLIGKPPEWAHPDYPNAGYFVELVDTRDVHALWQRHKERVEQVRERYHATVRPHDSLAIYRAIRRRFQDTQEAKVHLLPPILTVFTAVLVFFLVVTPFLGGRDAMRSTGAIMLLLRILLGAIVGMVVIVLIVRFGTAHLPVPLTSLDRLIQKVKE